jgi:hypothetical protein
MDALAEQTVAATAPAPGFARFATTDEQAAERVRLTSSGMLVVELRDIRASARGRFADLINEEIEAALEDSGAGAAAIAWSRDREAVLGDQLRRAQRAGASGIAILLGSMRAAGGATGALAPEDCATLSFLVRATFDRPLTILFDAGDEETGGYGDPVPMRDVLGIPSASPCPRTVPCPPPRPSIVPVAAPIVEPEDSSRSPASSTLPWPAQSCDHAENGWRGCTLQLTAARGPQPLTALEKLFTESYMPLTRAIDSGLGDARAHQAHDEFAATFAKGYTEAFSMFAAMAKRPRLVLDVHDIAGRIARLHGARSTRLLLVDGMRWDLSRMVQESVIAKLGARASLTDELLLWSALPTNTMRQLETIARGVESLRTPTALESESEPPRGRTPECIRRMRVGPRELSKLDLVEARVQAARGNVLRELSSIAEATAEAIARHIESLAARTLVFVFGDHGFTIDRAGVARQGGASPEEVLVGAFALLVGEAH